MVGGGVHSFCSMNRPRTGGFSSSVSSSRYNKVDDKFKVRAQSARREQNRGMDANARFHAALRASLKVSTFHAHGDSQRVNEQAHEGKTAVVEEPEHGRNRGRIAENRSGPSNRASANTKRVYRISREEAERNRVRAAIQKKDQGSHPTGSTGRSDRASSPKRVQQIRGDDPLKHREVSRMGDIRSSSARVRAVSAGRARTSSHQNGYHHPDSSAAQVANALDEDGLYDRDISNATGTSFAQLPSSVPGRRLSDFLLLEELGRGAHGVVHRVKSKIDKAVYVIKEIRLADLKPKRRKNVAQEVLLLRRLQHPNIIQYYTSFVENHALHIVMEFADGGDLYKELRRRRHEDRPMSEKKVWHYFSQCSSALLYLHNENIIHRDIKSMNVFLTRAGEVKLGDLGVSRMIDEDRDAQMSRVGTPMYFAPELVKREQYNFKVDTWALGCLVYSMMKLRAPFEGGNIYTLAVDIVKKAPKTLPDTFSQNLRHIVFSMLEKDPKRRPSMSELISMFPHNIRAKMGMDSPGQHSRGSENSMSTVSNLTRTRSSSRSSFYADRHSYKGGGKVLQSENCAAWQTITEEESTPSEPRFSKVTGKHQGKEESTFRSSIASHTGRSSIQENQSTSASSTYAPTTMISTVDSSKSKRDEFRSTSNANESRGRNDAAGLYRQENFHVDKLVNPQKFFEDTQLKARSRTHRPVSAGRVRDRRADVGHKDSFRRRQRPKSAGSDRRRIQSGAGDGRKAREDRPLFKLRPQSAGAVRGNRHRWNAPPTAVPDNAKIIVVKQFRP